jgi:hypothetical protein
LNSGPLRLELDNDANMILHLTSYPNIVGAPAHYLGRVPSDPGSNRVELLQRSCRPLPGTSFPGDTCQRQHLRGTFSTERNTRHFSGSYIITDEATNERCRYGFSLDLERSSEAQVQ